MARPSGCQDAERPDPGAASVKTDRGAGTVTANFDGSQSVAEIRTLGKLLEKGYLYRGLKPVYWCPTDETALADAETRWNIPVTHAVISR